MQELPANDVALNNCFVHSLRLTLHQPACVKFFLWGDDDFLKRSGPLIVYKIVDPIDPRDCVIADETPVKIFLHNMIDNNWPYDEQTTVRHYMHDGTAREQCMDSHREYLFLRGTYIKLYLKALVETLEAKWNKRGELNVLILLASDVASFSHWPSFTNDALQIQRRVARERRNELEAMDLD